MIGLSIVVLKSRPNCDGTIPIRIKISNVGTTAYIRSRYSLASMSEWKDGSVVKREDAAYINRRLRELIMRYEILADNPPRVSMTAVEIKRWFERGDDKGNIKIFFEKYIRRMEKEGRKSYAENLGYTLKYLMAVFGERCCFQEITPAMIRRFEKHLLGIGHNATSVNIRMTHFKAVLNASIVEDGLQIPVSPFSGYKLPQKAVRDICIDSDELKRLRDTVFSGRSEKRFRVARDLFMLSFYCAGINLTDLLSAKLDGDILTFERKKTAGRRHGGEKNVSITIQPEAREIIDRYMTKKGKMEFGYHYSDYRQFRSFVTKSLSIIGKDLGFEKPLMFYSARKTFCQFGFELGVPLYILEYAIGQTIKDANSRPIFNYIKIMRAQADDAIRRIIDHSFEA